MDGERRSGEIFLLLLLVGVVLFGVLPVGGGEEFAVVDNAAAVVVVVGKDDVGFVELFSHGNGEREEKKEWVVNGRKL